AGHRHAARRRSAGHLRGRLRPARRHQPGLARVADVAARPARRRLRAAAGRATGPPQRLPAGSVAADRDARRGERPAAGGRTGPDRPRRPRQPLSRARPARLARAAAGRHAGRARGAAAGLACSAAGVRAQPRPGGGGMTADTTGGPGGGGMTGGTTGAAGGPGGGGMTGGTTGAAGGMYGGVIGFEAVTVTYEDAATPVLRDFSLAVEEGELCLVAG